MNDSARTVTNLLARMLIVVTALWAALIMGLAIFNTRQHYNPAPVQDMWRAYLEFYENLVAGDWTAWWSLHNEHRLLLPHLLFWVDLRWLGGGSVLMLVANYVLAALLAAMFWFLLAKRIPGEKFATTRAFLGLLIVGALFLLCQGENLTSSQTNQFWLVFLLPLCGFYYVQKSPTAGATRDFLAACACGVLAAGAMASGLLALPLMTAYAILTRQRIVRIGILLFLSATVIVLYRFGSTGTHGISALITHPVKAISYVLTVLGGPVPFIFDRQGAHRAEGFGGVFLLGAGYKAARSLAKPRLDPLQSAMVFFILYILVTVIGITNGRMLTGLEGSTSRYTTVALVGWISLLILYSSDLAALKTTWRALLVLSVLPVMVLTTKAQIKALDNWDEPIFQAKAIWLGFALGVKDLAGATQLAGPGWARTLVPRVAEKAYQQHLSILGWYPFRGAREGLGATFPPALTLPRCQGSVDGVETISDARFFRVSGRLVNSAKDRKVEAVRLLDTSGREVGFAIMGQTTPDLNPNLAKRVLHERYRGYVLSSASGTNVIVQGENRFGPVCRMNAVMPEALYSVEQGAPDRNQVTIDSSSILPGNGWTGTDSYANLRSLGLQTYGSSSRGGDSDVGSISLNLKRGDRVLYRSGPIGGQQVLEIAGRPPVALPVAPVWVGLDFTGPGLPEGQFVAKLTDHGTGWGEWSAIALRAPSFPVLFSSTAAILAPNQITVTSENVLAGHTWTGSDAFHTDLCSSGLRIYGSFKKHGDADSGSISLRLRRSDRLLYRSGPTGGRQVLEIAGQPPLILPVTMQWSVLDLSKLHLSKDHFVAKFTDGGTGWGEWSAIAVRDDRLCP